MTRGSLVRAYYLATPGFAVLDLAVGASIRAAGLPSPGWRAAYYAFALGCGILLRARPRWTAAVGMGESAVNLFLLILSVMGPIFALPTMVAEGGEPVLPFGTGRLVNLMLSGCILIMSFNRRQAALGRDPGLGRASNLFDSKPRR